MRPFSFLITGCVFLLASCTKNGDERSLAEHTLNQWHEAAAHADYNSYFGFMDDDAIFIGTDATERWTKSEFEVYAKPHFEKEKAWSFTSLERTIYLDNHGKIAWFDELLDTSFKICRGSGVLNKQNPVGKSLTMYCL